MIRKNQERVGHCTAEGCDRPQMIKGLCLAHNARMYRWGELRPDVPLNPRGHDRVVTAQGYVRIKVPGHPRGGKWGWVLEHIVVMEGVLARELLLGEEVHHLNAVRDDNRTENLELWVVSQPTGARPADLVKWAKEILQRYE
jgi:hypothetical protein